MNVRRYLIAALRSKELWMLALCLTIMAIKAAFASPSIQPNSAGEPLTDPLPG